MYLLDTCGQISLEKPQFKTLALAQSHVKRTSDTLRGWVSLLGTFSAAPEKQSWQLATARGVREPSLVLLPGPCEHMGIGSLAQSPQRGEAGVEA